MLGLGKPKPVDEYEARGETERVYHQIRQTLRVTGVNLNFRTWAAFEEFFPAMWDAVQPNLETRILWGEDDKFQPVEYGERLAWDIPGARHVRDPGRAPFCYAGPAG
jgi:pimeloyl-ACP methyl ester carboxylesterase